MADSYTGNLNLRKPEVGFANNTWGGTSGLNADLDLLDGLFQKDGLTTVAPVAPHPNAGVPGVGLRVGIGYTLNVEGFALFKDHADVTRVAKLDSSLITTATTRTFYWPDEDGVIATRTYLNKMVPTGTVMSGYYGATPPTGFVFLDGRTIGDATSSATNRANADTVNLFTLMWNLNAGVLPSRGASASADWAAHRQVVLPDHSGRVMAGRDDLSGTNKHILDPGFPPGLSIARGNVGGLAQDSAFIQGLGVTVTVPAAGLAGSITGNITSDTPFNGLPVAGNTAGATTNVGDSTHQHVVQSNGKPVAISGTATGTGTINSGAATAVVTNVQPTIVVDVVIAL